MTDYADTSRLISNCLTGDEVAIEQLIHLYENGIYRLALSVVDDPAEANDITQETLIAALGALESYQDSGTFKTWLYTIALNLSRSRLRKQKTLGRLRSTIQTIFLVQSQKPPSPEDFVIRNEKEVALWNALEKLNEKHRLPIILRYYHNLPLSEIAEILNINEGTVSSRLHVGRERVRHELEKQSGFTGE
jgi:RNA polymerase sigma-70 factor, ECF subfamily